MSEDNTYPTFFPEEAGSNKLSRPSGDDLLVPHGYFEELECTIMTQRSAGENSDGFFVRQEEQIMQRISVSSNENEWLTPPDYFPELEKNIVHRIQTDKERRPYVTRRVLICASGIAAIIVIGLMLSSGPDQEGESFAALLEGTELTDEEMELFVTEEDFYEYYVDELDEMIADTLVPVQKSIAVTVPSVDEDTISLHLIKPSGVKDALRWEDLTEEDIMEYLMSEDDFNPLNELN